MSRRWTTRRELFTWVFGAASVGALTRFLPRLEAEAEAAPGDPASRYLSWYTPIMPAERLVLPLYQKNDGALRFPEGEAFAPLNEMSDRMLFLRGLKNIAAYDSAENGVSGGHKASGVTALAGHALQKKLNTDTDIFEGLGFRGESTFDQWLAHSLRQEKGIATPLADIRIGHRNQAHTSDNIWKTTSFFQGQMRSRHQNPSSLFAEMYPFTNTEPGEVPGYVQRHRSVLDYAASSVNRLQSRISRLDAQRLEQHLTAISEVERKLKVVEAQALSGNSCELDPSLDKKPADFDQVQDLYIKLITQAFSCDMTRVATTFFFSHLHGYGYDFLPEAAGNSFSYHGNTHGDGAGSAAQKDRFLKGVLGYRARTFIKLLRSLEEVDDADGRTLLDSTIVHWYTDVSRDHKWWDMFEIIAGSRDYFQLGQMKTFTKKNEDKWSHTRLLTSLCRAFGFEVDHFGDQKYDQGGLPADVLV